jgi:hypothetical protein
MFDATPPLWSSDGQELVFQANGQGPIIGGPVALASAPADPSLCSSLGLAAPCHPSELPPPDAAFATILQTLARPLTYTASDGHLYTNYAGADVAWSPNGKALATILPADQFSGPTTEAQRATISVLRTANGKPLARFPYLCPLVNGGCGLTWSWSPGGAQLGALVVGPNSQAVAIILWNTATLAH